MERKVELTDVFADGPIVRIPYDELDIKKVAEPVRHGKWIYTPTEPLGYVCSECGKSSCSFTYCPNCGAKMDGERKEDEADRRR